MPAVLWTVVSAIVGFFVSFFNAVNLSISFLMSKLLFRLFIAAIVYTFILAKINEFTANFLVDYLELPGDLLAFAGYLGVFTAINMIISAYVLAFALKAVKRVFIGG